MNKICLVFLNVQLIKIRNMDKSKLSVNNSDKLFKISLIGSGNWGTTIGKIVAENTKCKPHLFETNVKMWVFDEEVNGKKLTDIINEKNENIKYLPGIKLPINLIASPNIIETVDGADLLIFTIPHQFLRKIVSQIKGKVSPKARAISCLKGIEFCSDGCKLLSQVITDELGVHCGVLSGANIASEVAKELWSESSIAYIKPDDFRGKGNDVDDEILKEIFNRSYFRVTIINDVVGTSIAGALKNIVALAVGFVDGANWGNNSKSAIMRIGLKEIIMFSTYWTKFGIKSKISPNPKTFTEESAGVADLITTCFGGRNYKVGKYMVQKNCDAWKAESDLLNGQSCQGVVTVKEVHSLISFFKLEKVFPLFEFTYKAIYENANIDMLPKILNDFL